MDSIFKKERVCKFPLEKKATRQKGVGRGLGGAFMLEKEELMNTTHPEKP